MNLRVVIEYDNETSSYSAICPELPGCNSCGDSEAEAMDNIKEAISLYFEPESITLGPHAKVFEVAI